MAPTHQPLAIRKAIDADYLAWMCVVIPVVVWSFFLFLWLTGVGGPGSQNLWMVALAVTLVGVFFFSLRFAALRAHFDRGVEVNGSIERYMHLQDIGRVVYSFTYLTKEFRATNYIHHSTRTMRIEGMTAIKVIIDPANPHRALIKDLFFDQPGGEDT